MKKKLDKKIRFVAIIIILGIILGTIFASVSSYLKITFPQKIFIVVIMALYFLMGKYDYKIDIWLSKLVK